MKHTLKIGLFGIGLDTYWQQFAGLEDRLNGYVGQVAASIHRKKRGTRATPWRAALCEPMDCSRSGARAVGVGHFALQTEKSGALLEVEIAQAC